MSSPYADPLLHLEIAIVSGLYGILAYLYGNFIGMEFLFDLLFGFIVTMVSWGIFLASASSIRMRASMDILLFVLMGINIILLIAVWKYIGAYGRDLIILWILISLVTFPFSQVAEKLGISIINPSKFYLYVGLLFFWCGLTLKILFPTLEILDYITILGGFMLELWGSVRGLRVE